MEGGPELLVRPLLDEHAPLLLRANCVRSLALLCASDAGARRRVQQRYAAATLTRAVSEVLDATDAAVAPFLKPGGDASEISFSNRISTVTRLHGFNLLALFLHDGGGRSGVGEGGSFSPARSPSVPAILENKPRGIRDGLGTSIAPISQKKKKKKGPARSEPHSGMAARRRITSLRAGRLLQLGSFA